MARLIDAFTGRTMPAKEFVDALPVKDRNRMRWLFQAFADRWHLNEEQFNYEDDGLYAFKGFQPRVLGAFRSGGRFVLAHGIVKQTNKMPREAVVRALHVLAEWDARQVDARRR